jgi:hypothetical protein
MNVNPEVIGKLRQELADRSSASGLSYSEIGKKAQVHASQVSRICRGEFKTLSQNVVRICSTLGLSIQGFVDAERDDPAAARLISSVMAVWKGTEADADRIAAFLDRLGELREPTA